MASEAGELKAQAGACDLELRSQQSRTSEKSIEIRLSAAKALQVNQTLSNGGSSLNEVSKRNIDSTKYYEILKRVMKTRWRNSCVGLG